jgi:hypothetical protein
MPKVLTKAQALKQVTESLFRPGGTLGALNPVVFCKGPYTEAIKGRELDPNFEKYAPIWAEQRRDSEGPFYVLMCFDKRGELR